MFARFVYPDKFIKGLVWIQWFSGRVEAEIKIKGDWIPFDNLKSDEELVLRQLAEESNGRFDHP